ncbi:MAG: hypothetical protein HZB76_01290 [Chlamydiae bacterium]|nr:hypothetical protein [Chlamydiota bacterium]
MHKAEILPNAVHPGASSITASTISLQGGTDVNQKADINSAMGSLSLNGNISMTGGSAPGADAVIVARSIAFNSSTIELNQGAAPTARNATISATGGNITGSISTHLLLTSTTNGQSSITAAGNINLSTLGATTLTGSAANTAFIQATGGSNGITFKEISLVT